MPICKTSSPILAAISSLILAFSNSSATLAPHTPNVFVHESHYGTEVVDGSRFSVESIAVRIYCHEDLEHRFYVQCFFMKRGKPGGAPLVDDTILFKVTNPHAIYEVTANPIKLSSSTKTTSKSSSSKKTSSKSSTSSDQPREGYIVRILCDGVVLDTHAATHSLSKFAKENVELLDAAAAKKTARQLKSKLLVKK